MIIELIKFFVFALLIVLIAKYILVKVLRNLAQVLNLNPKINGIRTVLSIRLQQHHQVATCSTKTREGKGNIRGNCRPNEGDYNLQQFTKYTAAFQFCCFQHFQGNTRHRTANNQHTPSYTRPYRINHDSGNSRSRRRQQALVRQYYPHYFAYFPQRARNGYKGFEYTRQRNDGQNSG